MKLIFLGSGSAFTVGGDNYQSNMLLEDDTGNRLLIDCGTDIRFALHDQQLSYLDLTDIFISHLHSDHAGGLEYVGFNTLFDPRCNRPNLYIAEEIAAELWERSLSAGMRSVEGQITTLETFFRVNPVGQRRSFEWGGVTFFLIRAVHVNNGYGVMPSYGLCFDVEGVRVYITTDIQYQPDKLWAHYQKSTIIFHDCETSRFPSPVHAHYDQLLKLPEDVRRKTWLYGYQPGALPTAIADGFQGFVKRGQVFEFSQGQITTLADDRLSYVTL